MPLTRAQLWEVFPTTTSLVIFLLYMAMFVAQGMLVTVSRKGSVNYSYNTTMVVLLTEGVKLVISTAVFLRDGGLLTLCDTVVKQRKVLALYLVPAFLYCLYNNLAFVNLSYFDPTTYFMFMQIRLLMTGVIYQFLFSRKLSRQQWLSLLLLTMGCMLKGLEEGNMSPHSAKQLPSFQVVSGLLLILLQVMCSVVAGVYNEYLIKSNSSDVHIMIQNVFMYLDSILCNILLLGVKGDFYSELSIGKLSSLVEPIVLVLVVNNALLGIVTSLFLKNLNSVVKAFASALELVFTALLSLPVLGIPIGPYTASAVVVICLAVVMYAKNPIKNDTPMKEKASTEGGV